MARQRHTVEEIINKLREAEVGLAGGLAVPEVCRSLSRQTGQVNSFRRSAAFMPGSATKSTCLRPARPGPARA